MKSALGLGLVLALIGFVPLFGGPRYEAALVAGLLGPVWCAVATALSAFGRFRALVVQSREDGVRRLLPGVQVSLDGIICAALHLGAVLLVALLHGLRTGFCEPGPGFGLLVAGPGMGMLLAALIGSLAGTAGCLLPGRSLVAGRLFAVAVAAGFPLGSIALGLLHFYSSPAVYAYDPFVGYFAGPLYDTVQYDLPRLMTFRAGTLMTVLAIVSLVAGLVLTTGAEGRRGARFLEPTMSRVTVLVAGAILSVASAGHAAIAEDLGHSSTAASIQKALGRVTEAGRCRVYFSTGVSASDAQRTASECVGHLAQLEKFFEVEPIEGVDVYLFANSGEKRYQMGAGDTYIAKPWRGEIYLQAGDFPHQVLGHELAHVVTGEFGAGPLKIAGMLGGLVPDPGRIEGFAEAASPREHSEGTLHEWTAAMKKLDQLPALHSLFRLTFLGNSAARSYSASGSFVAYAHETLGAAMIKDWYQGGDLETLSGKSWPALERDWHGFLDGVAIPQDVLEIARPRFSRPGVFERRCPHAVDRAISGAHGYCPFQEQKARSLAAEAVEMDPTKVDLDLTMARCGWYVGDAERSRAELEKLSADEQKYEPGARRAAYDFAGNIAWNQGKPDEASALYEKARGLAYRRDQIRQLDVKQWALKQDDDTAETIRALLAPQVVEAQIPAVRLGAMSREGNATDLGKYLLARVSLQAGAVQHADELMTELDDTKLPVPSVRREAGRMKVLSACRRVMKGAEDDLLQKAMASYKKGGLSAAETLEVDRVAERCRTSGALRKEAP